MLDKTRVYTIWEGAFISFVEYPGKPAFPKQITGIFDWQK